jgi:diguanylate cyclase (GGDEF)-like protein
MERNTRLATLLLGLGKGRAEAAIVGASVGGSLLLTTLSLSLLRDAGISWHVPVTIATIVPLAVSTPVAIAIMGLLRQLDRARHQAHQAANTDPLTGLLNRRSWIDLAVRELRRAAVADAPAALLMLDVDHFKRTNDVHGHRAGDAVLQSVAQLCQEMLRPQDLVARWGGEEFVMLLPGVGRNEAAQIAERMRESVQRRLLEVDGRHVHVTGSIGVVGALEDAAGHDLERLLHLADAAMYTAKQNGRNRVAMAPEDGPDFGSTARMRRLTLP